MSIFKKLYQLEKDINKDRTKQIATLLKEVKELKENLSVASDLNTNLIDDKKELQNNIDTINEKINELYEKRISIWQK